MQKEEEFVRCCYQSNGAAIEEECIDQKREIPIGIKIILQSWLVDNDSKPKWQTCKNGASKDQFDHWTWNCNQISKRVIRRWKEEV